MNKKFLLLAALIVIISFSAGVFTEILVPAGRVQLSTDLPAASAAVMDYLKSDALTVLAALIFSATVVLMPAVALLALGKTFSLGFSAAYILSCGADKAFGILLAALLPRGLFKIPAYMALICLSFQTARLIRANYLQPAHLRAALIPCLRGYLLCFLTLAASSILEAFLLQGVL